MTTKTFVPIGDSCPTPLHDAACKGDALSLERLLKQGVDELEIRNDAGETPLHLAARGNRVEAAITLIRHGADVNATTRAGGTPLHHAAAFGYRRLAEILFLSGADPNLADNNSDRPIHLAVNKCHAGVVCTLSDADRNACDGKGRTPLHIAVWNNDRVMVGVLVALGASVHETDGEGRTPLAYAKQLKNRESVVDFLSGRWLE